MDQAEEEEEGEEHGDTEFRPRASCGGLGSSVPDPSGGPRLRLSGGGDDREGGTVEEREEDKQGRGGEQGEVRHNVAGEENLKIEEEGGRIQEEESGRKESSMVTAVEGKKERLGSTGSSDRESPVALLTLPPSQEARLGGQNLAIGSPGEREGGESSSLSPRDGEERTSASGASDFSSQAQQRAGQVLSAANDLPEAKRMRVEGPESANQARETEGTFVQPSVPGLEGRLDADRNIGMGGMGDHAVEMPDSGRKSRSSEERQGTGEGAAASRTQGEDARQVGGACWPMRRGRREAPAAVAPYQCQVDGCQANGEGAKEYHRRHRVCVVHSRSLTAVVRGLVQRFCQQCSRFHDLSEFEGTKRSCRRRLVDHNRRRRKGPNYGDASQLAAVQPLASGGMSGAGHGLGGRSDEDPASTNPQGAPGARVRATAELPLTLQQRPPASSAGEAPTGLTPFSRRTPSLSAADSALLTQLAALQQLQKPHSQQMAGIAQYNLGGIAALLNSEAHMPGPAGSPRSARESGWGAGSAGAGAGPREAPGLQGQLLADPGVQDSAREQHGAFQGLPFRLGLGLQPGLMHRPSGQFQEQAAGGGGLTQVQQLGQSLGLAPPASNGPENDEAIKIFLRSGGSAEVVRQFQREQQLLQGQRHVGYGISPLSAERASGLASSRDVGLADGGLQGNDQRSLQWDEVGQHQHAPAGEGGLSREASGSEREGSLRSLQQRIAQRLGVSLPGFVLQSDLGLQPRREGQLSPLVLSRSEGGSQALSWAPGRVGNYPQMFGQQEPSGTRSRAEPAQSILATVGAGGRPDPALRLEGASGESGELRLALAQLGYLGASGQTQSQPGTLTLGTPRTEGKATAGGTQLDPGVDPSTSESCAVLLSAEGAPLPSLQQRMQLEHEKFQQLLNSLPRPPRGNHF